MATVVRTILGITFGSSSGGSKSKAWQRTAASIHVHMVIRYRHSVQLLFTPATALTHPQASLSHANEHVLLSAIQPLAAPGTLP